jgi:predicted HTH transcriptional regulator
MTKAIQDIVAEGNLPENSDDVLPLISNGEEYISQEGETWDFKETWPFSYSDDYFGGLARLVCAFANTSGGLIIFGVDDSTRKGGRTKTQPNVDRFEQAFEQLTGVKAPIQLRRYKSLTLGDVDILLVSRKQSSQLPFRFSRRIGNYPPDTKLQ